jgi:ectoine hydroxylase-related dioxygenase (phytanoyl-CoA dioxygenase family)
MFSTLTATTTEVERGALDADRAEAAAAALWEDGAVVLADVVDREHLRVLREQMEAELPELVRRGRTNGPAGHYAQGPPVAAPFVFADVLANRIAVQVSQIAVGYSLQLTLLNANSIVPCTEAQNLHRDQGNLWKDMPETHRPWNIAVHVPLTDATADNGATEVWPGTHRLAHKGPVPTDDAELEARAASSPPVALTCPAGGIILRDNRAWHRGMPNRTDQPRIMLSLIYAAAWSRSGPIHFHRSAEPVLRDAPLEIHPVWVDDDFDHLQDFRDRATNARAARTL